MDILKEKKEFTSLTSVIFEKLKDDIINNEYEIGEKITESEIAEELCISKTPVREALKQLLIDGLIEEIANKGFFVKGISEQEMIDICILRSLIEDIVIRWAVERINEADLKKLDDICSLMEFYCLKGNVNKVLDLGTKFHETIYKSIHSHILEHTLKHFHILVKKPRMFSIKKEGRMYESILEHRLILDALIERDVEKAVYHSVNHSKAMVK